MIHQSKPKPSILQQEDEQSTSSAASTSGTNSLPTPSLEANNSQHLNSQLTLSPLDQIRNSKRKSLDFVDDSEATSQTQIASTPTKKLRPNPASNNHQHSPFDSYKSFTNSANVSSVAVVALPTPSSNTFDSTHFPSSAAKPIRSSNISQSQYHSHTSLLLNSLSVLSSNQSLNIDRLQCFDFIIERPNIIRKAKASIKSSPHHHNIIEHIRMMKNKKSSFLDKLNKAEQPSLKRPQLPVSTSEIESKNSFFDICKFNSPITRFLALTPCTAITSQLMDLSGLDSSTQQAHSIIQYYYQLYQFNYDQQLKYLLFKIRNKAKSIHP